MKIVFMGTPDFAVPSLEILINHNYDVCTVVTVPDKKKGRGMQMQSSSVKLFAESRNLPVLQPDSLKDEAFISKIKELNPDVIVVVAFRILPEEIYSIPGKGTFNLHASLLPKYRGAAPINRAIMNGECITGVTTFFLQKKVDTGNIIMQLVQPIDLTDNAGNLHDKLSVLGAEAVLKTIQRIESGNVETITQDDSIASNAPKIFKDDCRINWNQKAENVHNFIRGLSPYPAAITTKDNKSVKIFETEFTEILSAADPGYAFIYEGRLCVCAFDSVLSIKSLQLEGKKRISASDFIIGLQTREPFRFI